MLPYACRCKMIAAIGDKENMASRALHAKFGFRLVSELQSVGFKFGRWLTAIRMQRSLGDGDTTLPE